MHNKRDLVDACQLLLGDPSNPEADGYWLRDLGYLGIEANSWEGLYSDTVNSLILPTARSRGICETRNAVYAALAADWQDAGWAAAQVWPDGVRMGSEQVARLHQSTCLRKLAEGCFVATPSLMRLPILIRRLALCSRTKAGSKWTAAPPLKRL